MRLMKYEGECTENMEWVESYKIEVNKKNPTAINLMLLKMIDWIDKTTNNIDKLWRQEQLCAGFLT